MALAVAFAGACTSADSAESVRQRGYRGVVLEPPLEKPEFTLTDTDGRPYDFAAETEGKLALVFVGYTHCPDVCPVHMANLAAVLKQMPQVEARSEVVFISADPERDTPERIREWLDTFSPRFVGLRGTPEEVHRVERALNLPRSVVPEDGGNEYAVGHAGQVIAFSPDGVARVVYPFGTRQTDYAHDLKRLIQGSGAAAAGMSVPRAYVVAPIGDAPAAMYVSVSNPSGAPDTLLAVETPAAERAELHEQTRTGDVMRMRRLEALEVPARGTLAMAPGGRHVMLIGIEQALVPGETVPVQLTFSRAGRVTAEARVISYGEVEEVLGPMSGPASHGGH